MKSETKADELLLLLETPMSSKATPTPQKRAPISKATETLNKAIDQDVWDTITERKMPVNREDSFYNQPTPLDSDQRMATIYPPVKNDPKKFE